jgi:hypothetical protein
MPQPIQLMECKVCSNLLGNETAALAGQSWTPGRRLAKLVLLSELLDSKEKGACAECALVFDAVHLYHPDWEAGDLASSTELRVDPGKTLQVNWPRGSIFLELFTRDGM